MKTFKITLLPILLCLIISTITTSCIPPSGGGTPTPVVSDSLAIGRYFQTNVITNELSTIIRGGSVELNADNTVNILILQTFTTNQFPYIYNFTGTYTKSGNSINFNVVYTGTMTIPNPSRTINGTLKLITNVTPNKVGLKFNTIIPFFPAVSGEFIFEKE